MQIEKIIFLVVGYPSETNRHIGPFPSEDEASEWAGQNLGSVWLIRTMEIPTESSSKRSSSKSGNCAGDRRRLHA